MNVRSNLGSSQTSPNPDWQQFLKDCMELSFYVQHIKYVVQYEHFSLGCMLYSIWAVDKVKRDERNFNFWVLKNNGKFYNREKIILGSVHKSNAFISKWISQVLPIRVRPDPGSLTDFETVQ